MLHARECPDLDGYPDPDDPDPDDPDPYRDVPSAMSLVGCLACVNLGLSAVAKSSQ